MDVYLIRHAIAHERNRKRWPNDALRPLTTAGKQRFRKAARGLASLLPKSAQVFTSPFVRARDTAAILIRVAKLANPVEAEELAASASVRKAFEFLRSRKIAAVVLVGHEPNLSSLLTAALAGDRARFTLEFKKGGAACLRFEKAVAPGGATLRWMLPPRVLRKVGLAGGC
jgi:phosphohistidine phosphatase